MCAARGRDRWTPGVISPGEPRSELQGAPGNAADAPVRDASPRMWADAPAITAQQANEECGRATRAGRGREGGGNDRMRPIRRRRPARAAAERPRTQSARIRTVRRQAGVEAGRPRSLDRLRAPRGRWPLRPWRRPTPTPGIRSRLASRSHVLQAPRARIFSRPSAFDASRELPRRQGDGRERVAEHSLGPGPDDTASVYSPGFGSRPPHGTNKICASLRRYAEHMTTSD